MAVPSRPPKRPLGRNPGQKDGDGQRHDGHAVSEAELASSFSAEQSEAQRRAVRRRKRRHLIVVLALTVVVAAGLGAALLFALRTGGGGVASAASTATAAKTSRCGSETFLYQDPSSVHLNIYNGTDRAGLARDLSATLKLRGFVVEKVGNRQLSTTAPGVIIAGKAGKAAAYTAQQNLPGFDFIQDDRASATVDVVLASGFKAAIDHPKTASGSLSCPGVASTVSAAP